MLIQVLTSAAAADKEQLLQTKKFFSSIYIRVLKINILLVKFEIFADASLLISTLQALRTQHDLDSGVLWFEVGSQLQVSKLPKHIALE